MCSGPQTQRIMPSWGQRCRRGLGEEFGCFVLFWFYKPWATTERSETRWEHGGRDIDCHNEIWSFKWSLPSPSRNPIRWAQQRKLEGSGCICILPAHRQGGLDLRGVAGGNEKQMNWRGAEGWRCQDTGMWQGSPSLRRKMERAGECPGFWLQ